MPPALAAAIRATARGLGVWLGKYCTIFLGARVEELPPDARCQGRAREPAVPVGHRIERPGIWLAVANYRTVWRAFYSLGALALIWYRSIVGGKRLARDLDALFDADYYRESNPDVAASRWPPRVHYLLFGGPEGRNPHPLFDVSYYLSRYPDVRKSRINPLFHYVLFGAAEGRSTYPSFAAGAYGGAISDAARLTPGRSPSAGPARTAIAWRKKRDESGTLWKWFRAVYDTTRGATVAAEPATEATEPAGPGDAAAGLRLSSACAALSTALEGVDALVSVVIPCFNSGKYIGDAAGSVLSQTYSHVEIVVIDNGSTDPETLAALEEIRRRGVKVVRQTNQGLAQGRNYGASASTGEYLLFPGADDRLERSAIGLLLYALLRNPSVAYAYSAQRFSGDREPIRVPREFNAYDLLWSNDAPACLMIRRPAFDAVGGYRTGMPDGGEDWELRVRLSGQGHFGVCVPAPVIEHRRNGATAAQPAQQRQRLPNSQILAFNSGAYLPESIMVRKQTWRPLVSVVIPFYNRTTYLAETLASLERQTTRDFEVILINDGSCDPQALGFWDELRTAGWIRRVDCEHRGQAAARNRGAMLARSEYLMFLDADDLLEASAIEKLCWTLAARPEASFVYSGVTHFGDMEAVCFDEFDAGRLYRENYLTVTCVIRREAFLAAGGFDESLTDTHEDYDFWLRLVEQGRKGELFREALFRYRRHSAGASAARISRSPHGARALAQSVVARHRGGAARPPALPDASRPAPEALLTEVTASPRTESYRRPNLPNLFCPRVWTSGRIHILYLVPWCAAGGAEVFDLRIFSCLPRDRFRITVVACEQPDGAWYGQFGAAVEELYSLQRMGRDQETRMAFLRYLMVSKRIDIVFNRNTFLGYELAANWPAVSAETRFVDLLHLHADGEDWVAASAPYHEKLDLRFVISENLREYAIGKYGLSPGRFRVLRYGMSAEQMPELHVSLDRRRAIREKWGIPDSACVVGFIGRLTEQKDPRRWISIAARIAAVLPSTVFLVVGDGEMLSESVAAARKRIGGKTIFAGYQSDAAEYCAAMDVLLMTSRYEGVPLAMLESLASGTPVVSTDVGAVRECLDSSTGVVLSADAPDDAYAKAVMEVMKRDRATVWAEARSLLLSHFSKDRMENQLQQELSLLAAGLDRDARRRDYQLDLMARPILA